MIMLNLRWKGKIFLHFYFYFLVNIEKIFLKKFNCLKKIKNYIIQFLLKFVCNFYEN